MKNSKNVLVIVFRVIIIVTFLAGAMYVVNFRKLAVGLDKATDQTTLSLVSKWTNTYYLYLGLMILGVIFSIVCFKSTKNWVSTVRTVFLAGSVVCTFAAKSVVDVFRAVVKVDINDPSSVVDATKGIYGLQDAQFDDMVAKLLLPYLSVLILFVLMITSVATLIGIYEKSMKQDPKK